MIYQTCRTVIHRMANAKNLYKSNDASSTTCKAVRFYLYLDSPCWNHIQCKAKAKHHIHIISIQQILAKRQANLWRHQSFTHSSIHSQQRNEILWSAIRQSFFIRFKIQFPLLKDANCNLRFFFHVTIYHKMKPYNASGSFSHSWLPYNSCSSIQNDWRKCCNDWLGYYVQASYLARVAIRNPMPFSFISALVLR